MSDNDELQDHTCEKMLEFYGNVANNVANEKVQLLDHIVETTEKVTVEKVQNLTEQWKNGELDDGFYYVKIIGDKFYMLERADNHWYEFGWDCYFFDEDVVEVLGEIPSYGDCLINEALIKDLSKKVNKLIEENAKLKELLKDCRDELDKYDSYTDFNEVGRYKLLTKINEALK